MQHPHGITPIKQIHTHLKNNNTLDPLSIFAELVQIFLLMFLRLEWDVVTSERVEILREERGRKDFLQGRH